MNDGTWHRRWLLRWAVAASLALHAALAAFLLFGLPVSLPEPQPEQAISVQLVPPPKPPEKPPEKPAAKPSAEPPEKPQPEKPPAKKPEAEKRPEAPAKTSATETTSAPPLKPVVQYGEKDAGPRDQPDGDSAEADSTAAPPSPEPAEESAAQAPGIDAEPTEQGTLPAASKPPGAGQVPRATVSPAKAPQKARKQLSQPAADAPVATTAMDGLPRSARAGRLCVTELREQLANSLPPYLPDLLPSYQLKEGTVLDVPQAAFRVDGRWYDLAFRCALDTEVTKVVSFAFHVGAALPRSEWQRRGLPAE